MPTTLPVRLPLVTRDETVVPRGNTIAIAVLVTWAVAMLLFGSVARWGDPASDAFETIVAF